MRNWSGNEHSNHHWPGWMCSQKLKRPAPAQELYVSQLFKKASAYTELTCDRWYVLSAMHGLVHPHTVLESYDMRLGTHHKTSPPIHQGVPW
jgi:hypothetical protein